MHLCVPDRGQPWYCSSFIVLEPSAGWPEGPWDPPVSASLAGITPPPRLVFYMDSGNLIQGPMLIRQTLKRLSHLSSPKKKLIS